MLNNHIYIDWYSVKDPHPAAMSNLNALVSYMVANNYTDNLNPVTVYRLAKDLSKHPKQINSLVVDRPGFVRVIRNGKSLGYYWKRDMFGGFYPQTLSGHRGRKLLAVEDLATTEVETVQQFNQRMPEMAKQLAKTVEEVKQPEYTEISLPGGGKRAKVIVEFSLVEDVKGATFVAFDQLMDRNRTVEKKEESGLALVNILLTRLLAIKETNVQRERPQES